MINCDPYIDKASKSIFRFEGLQDYSAEDGEDSVQEYIKTGVLPFRSSESEWWQKIRKKNQNGVRTHRVRLVSFPVTDYTKMELALHRESAQFSGEDIRIIEQAVFDAVIGKTIPDFYLVDDEYVFPLEYGPKGKFLGDALVAGEEISDYLKWKKLLLNNSVSIKEWKF